MWLLDTTTLQLKPFEARMKPYAILSHTWSDDEITFQQIQAPHSTVVVKSGYKKVERFCSLAREKGFTFCWVDTCCIDKTSSAELSEAINSMFQWYSSAALCIVYLSDVSGLTDPDEESSMRQLDQFRRSRWFTRGFTLQELIAPRERVFLAEDWSEIKGKHWPSSLNQTVSSITGIDLRVLVSRMHLWDTCLAERMSWAAHRETTKSEDVAYSLLGIFNVNMAILYGEGPTSAFKRLQLEILKSSFDQTLFAWRECQDDSGLLADNPNCFRESPKFGLWAPYMLSPVTVTNVGTVIRACIAGSTSSNTISAVLQCDVMTQEGWMCLYLRLKRIDGVACSVFGQQHQAYRRINCDSFFTLSSDELDGDNQYTDIIVLEDDTLDLVETSDRQHTSRWSGDAFGESRMTLTLRQDERRTQPL